MVSRAAWLVAKGAGVGFYAYCLWHTVNSRLVKFTAVSPAAEPRGGKGRNGAKILMHIVVVVIIPDIHHTIYMYM